MDQIKSGKFIATLRKEKGYTQATLAEQLGITDRAVSKWETGKSFPDSSILLELCDILSITVNELLKGERIAMEDIKKASEEITMELRIKDEAQTKMLLKLEVILGVLAIISLLGFVLSGIFLMQNADYRILGGIQMAIGFIIIWIFAFVGVWIEQRAGYYECAECGHCYRPTYSQVLWAPHYGRTRKMNCPKCGKKSYQKKVVSEGK